MDRARGQGGDRDAEGKLRPNLWVDDLSVALLKQQDAAREALGEWLAGFRWQVYVVLSFAHRPSPTNAKGTVDRWLRELRRTYYPRLVAFISLDRGKGGDRRLNIHVFLGGLFVHKPPPPGLHRTLAITRAIELARRTWTSGLVKKCEPFDPRRGAPSYLAQYCNDTDLGGDFFGRPIKKRKQRKRGQSYSNHN